MKRLGVVGTMVWDRIHAREAATPCVEEWGGIAYALAAAAAALPENWEIVPLIKVGRDLEEQAFHFLRRLPGLQLHEGVRVVPEANNRVVLHYHDRERRFERLTGGVPPWTWEELRPTVATLDALYVNFISGFEFGLETAGRMRLEYQGPIYADLHSIFLGIDAAGRRMPRALVAWREWVHCFDVIQVNEDELTMLASAWGDPWRFAADLVGEPLRLLLVTLGARGAAYVARADLDPQPLAWRSRGLLGSRPLVATGPVKSERFMPPAGPVAGDPTGCGDVWGATCFTALLAGHALDAAVLGANAAAARNVTHRGATGLYHHLKGRIAT